ncbi:MAG: VOC family protein [Caulobacteraceae bacterium]|nr:MAG: VOC family protein [Caulobacteraceae bacterium]
MITFSELVPVFRILDVAKALEFYRDYLGMTVAWEHRFEPTLPLYMQVERDGLVLHLSEHYGDALPGSTIRVKVKGLAALHAELKGKQYGYLRPGLQRDGDGLEVNLLDPFGNKLRLYEPLKD